MLIKEVEFGERPTELTQPDEHEDVYAVDDLWELKQRRIRYPKGPYACIPAGSRDDWRGMSINDKVEHHNARAVALGAKGTLDAAQWARWSSVFMGCCAYCGHTVANPVLEHVIPLSRGGETTICNVVPACWECNMNKGRLDPVEWLGWNDAGVFFRRVKWALAKMHCFFKEDSGFEI